MFSVCVCVCVCVCVSFFFCGLHSRHAAVARRYYGSLDRFCLYSVRHAWFSTHAVFLFQGMDCCIVAVVTAAGSGRGILRKKSVCQFVRAYVCGCVFSVLVAGIPTGLPLTTVHPGSQGLSVRGS